MPEAKSQPNTPTCTTDAAVKPRENNIPHEDPVKTTSDGLNTDVYTTRSGRTIKPVKTLAL